MDREANRKSFLLIPAFLLAILCTAAVGRTIYVDDDGPADFNNIQAAIDDANDGDIILVADGNYTEDGNRDIDFWGKAITLRSENGSENCIIDCEDLGHRGFYFHSGEDTNSVVSGLTIKRGRVAKGAGIYCSGSSPTIENCTIISNGAYNYDFFEPEEAYGGGIYCGSNSNPTIINCTISNNTAIGGSGFDFGMGGLPAWGGGIYCSADSHPRVEKCIIANNECLGGWASWSVGPGAPSGHAFGGGIYGDNLRIEDCIIINNTAVGGRGCVGNPGVDAGEAFGGGIYGDNATIQNCVVTGNIVTGGNGGDGATEGGSGGDAYGGGIYGTNLTIQNCVISNNTPTGGNGGDGATKGGSGGNAFGGSIYGTWLAIQNCVIAGNTATGGNPSPGGFCGNAFGGGIYCNSAGNINNCTIINNEVKKGIGFPHGRSEGGGVWGSEIITISNCILWGNTSLFGPQIYGNCPTSYSDVQSGYSGTGNINVDPCFANTAGGDYHLKSQAGRWDPNEGRWTKDEVTSLCIDAGDPSSPIGFEPFPNGGIINMGAYGGTVEASKSYFGEPICETIVAGDINGDCIVNFKDFAIMSLHWLEDNN